MTPDLGNAVARRMGSNVVAAEPLAGGDIHAALCVRLADGRRVFVKSHPSAPGTMFAAEARGLEWLREAGALRVPEVLAFSDPAARDGTRFLILEYIEPAPKVAAFDELLGRSLAQVHRAGSPTFGFDHDNFIGPLAQLNAPAADWPTFYAERRLEPLLRQAADAGLAGTRLRRDFEALFARMTDLVGPPEPPSRLHGDLWGGNLHIDDRGHPCLIDPAVYGGHREIDLAMMRLFGGFGPRVFHAYREAWPLLRGVEERVALYQLYPLLVHLNVFGAAYSSGVASALERALG
jgi:fructosamine-3-kinase